MAKCFFVKLEDGRVICNKCGVGMRLNDSGEWVDLSPCNYCPSCGRKVNKKGDEEKETEDIANEN